MKKFTQTLSEGFIKYGRAVTLVHILLENDGCRTDGIVDDEKCVLQSLSRIILFFETGRAPRPHYDHQDAAIELEAIANFLSDMSGSEPRMAEALKIFMKLGGGNFWQDSNEEIVGTLRAALRALKSQSNVEYEE